MIFKKKSAPDTFVIKKAHTAIVIASGNYLKSTENYDDALDKIEALMQEGYRVVGYADASYKMNVLLVKDYESSKQ